jgi:hypothetical protein
VAVIAVIQKQCPNRLQLSAPVGTWSNHYRLFFPSERVWVSDCFSTSEASTVVDLIGGQIQEFVIYHITARNSLKAVQSSKILLHRSPCNTPPPFPSRRKPLIPICPAVRPPSPRPPWLVTCCLPARLVRSAKPTHINMTSWLVVRVVSLQAVVSLQNGSAWRALQ